MAFQQAFVEEIDYNELEFIEIVGRGAFGVVSRARWRSIDVAVKLIETESEKKAFITELKQLSRVNHVNIVKLYGACTKQPVCLVMEYAEGGSLYNVLHGSNGIPSYSAAHAMTWCLQCARGVEYLHGMKPKPLVHRDLKPPNLLLIARGTVLKICDFGTACDAHTHMTNNKGSAAWMAPEVFEGSNYSEKCDVFSWGIILWEVITRRKPFDEIGGPAFRIMWAVHNGTRPPLVKNCPKPIEILMTRCWSANPFERPSMAEVVRIMTHLSQFFSGAEEPLHYAITDQNQNPKVSDTQLSIYDNPQLTGFNHTRDSRSSTMQETIHRMPRGFVPPVPQGGQTPQSQNPPFYEDNARTSAPASLQASRENLHEYHRQNVNAGANDEAKRYSADLSSLPAAEQLQAKQNAGVEQELAVKPIPPVRKHRRTGSHGTPFVPEPSQTAAVRGHKRTGSSGSTVIVTSASYANPAVDPSSTLPHSVTAPGSLDSRTILASLSGGSVAAAAAAIRSMSWAPGWQQNPIPFDFADGTFPANFFNPAQQYLQPLPPCPSCPESVAIYQQHRQLADEYLRIQAEIAMLLQRRKELLVECQQDETERMNNKKINEDYQKLLSDNDDLKLLQSNLKRQLAQIKQQRQRSTRL